MANPILPGATIGIFGSGQLGRMMTLAAKQMGYRVATFSPQADSPTGQVADREIVAAYDDAEAVIQFAQSVDVITFEFENVDARVADICESAGAPVHPGGWVLRTAQNRISEKSALLSADLPVTPFIPVRTKADLAAAAARLGFPIVLKTATSGYDGKGQIVTRNAEELADAWDALGRAETVAEAWLDFSKEISVIVVRSSSHDIAVYRVFENTHVDHILDASICPAAVSAAIELRAQDLARRVAETLNSVGALCVEFFLMRDGALLINEIAPRPHNSGHLTIEAAVTSQFEQHIRAICGLPLGSVDQPRAAAMVNLLGDLWTGGTPAWDHALRNPAVKLHLYGKLAPRPGRKMGHMTVVAPLNIDSPEQYALHTALSARDALSRSIHHPVEQSGQRL